MLLQELSQNDRLVMEKYIALYGARGLKPNLDEWLKYWNHSKRKLYKLLGNQLIYKIPYEYEKDSSIIEYEIREQLLEMPFRRIYHNFYADTIRDLYRKGLISKDVKNGFSSITDWQNFANDRITQGIKIKRDNARKTLQIQKGMKPVRALQKIMEYFPDCFEVAEKLYNEGHTTQQEEVSYKQAFEDFRLAHSMIFNDKTIKGNLCISIHPMDFMTMSDNDSDWSSCMSWINDGCYKIGSVEMMNSNNVLCCYLESNKPLLFKEEEGKRFEWNNKKWRTLVYYTNDIIMSGKAYPYSNDDISKRLIYIIRCLAKENLHRTFSFGPELYQDMIHINGIAAMQNNYMWMHSKENSKHNIIWDTKGMYNDMLNDNNTKYWCYRNKVKHKKIYQVSGKAPCLCCGEDVIVYDEDEQYEYNDRYSNVGAFVCYDCEQDNSCDYCHTLKIDQSYKKISSNMKVCPNCFNKWVKRCPTCNKPFNLMNKNIEGYIQNKQASLKNPSTLLIYSYLERDIINYNEYFEPIFVCKDCENTLNHKYVHFSNNLGRRWSSDFQIFPWTEELDKFKYLNLKNVPFDTEEEILN